MLTKFLQFLFLYVYSYFYTELGVVGGAVLPRVQCMLTSSAWVAGPEVAGVLRCVLVRSWQWQIAGGNYLVASNFSHPAHDVR